MSAGKEDLNFKLADGESVTFRYRIIVYPGDSATDEVLNGDVETFSEK